MEFEKFALEFAAVLVIKAAELLFEKHAHKLFWKFAHRVRAFRKKAAALVKTASRAP